MTMVKFPRSILLKLHLSASVLALTLLLSFWTASIWSELTGDLARIGEAKRAIVFGLGLLIPCSSLPNRLALRFPNEAGRQADQHAPHPLPPRREHRVYRVTLVGRSVRGDKGKRAANRG